MLSNLAVSFYGQANLRMAKVTQSDFSGPTFSARGTNNASPNDVSRQEIALGPNAYDDQVMQELRDLLGDVYVAAALIDLSTALDQRFANVSATGQDRQDIFHHAHFIVGRAGLMGFPLLHDRCVALQNSCMAGDCIASSYAEARKSAIATIELIARLAHDIAQVPPK